MSASGILPGPQKLGTGGTRNGGRKWERDRGRPPTSMCKNGFIASIALLCVFPTDKGDKAGVDPYNRILARA